MMSETSRAPKVENVAVMEGDVSVSMVLINTKPCVTVKT